MPEYVYVMASRSRTLYTGVNGHLASRVHQQKIGQVPGFASRYEINRLVNVERSDDVRVALAREKQIGSGARAKRLALIESANPMWMVLGDAWFGSADPSLRSG